MKYRTKLYLILLAVSTVSLCLGLSITYFETKKFVMEEFRSKALSIAASTAALLDGDVLKKINSPEDENLPEYQEFREKLRKSRNYNQRRDIFVIYLYTLKPSTDESQLLMAVSAADTPEETIPIGEAYESKRTQQILESRLDHFSPEKFSEDAWGTWLSGYSPIYDSEGNYVATLGIDIDADEVKHELTKLLFIGLYSLAISLVFAILGGYFLSHMVTSPLRTLCNAVEKIGKGEFNQRVQFKSHDEFNELANSLNKMSKGLQERERLKMSFARYVSSYVLDKALKSESLSQLQGERKKVTVLFSDIRDFTTLSEKLPPESVVRILNEYFERMIDVIFEFNGTLDKFLGDGLMVEFGAPVDDPDQEKHAVQAALKMQQQLDELSKQWTQEGRPLIQIGIGIHTGQAIVGNIGSEKRVEYTAVGDTVNLASRIEEATKEKKLPILISEATYLPIKDQFNFQEVGEETFKGRSDKTKIYTIIS